MQEKELMVSVICNTYNQVTYIRDALDSFLMQKTNFPFEILVHDDASTDGTADIIREYEQKYPELIKPIYQTENQYSQGNFPTKNFQVPRAKGKYIAFCEGDDYWTDPHKLQKQFDIMEKNPQCSLCVHIVNRVEADTKNLIGEKPSFQLNKSILKDIDFFKEGRLVFLDFQLSSYFVPSKLIKNYYSMSIAFRDVSTIGDEPLIMWLLTEGDFFFINQKMSSYRILAKGSWTSRIKEETPQQFYKYIFQKLQRYYLFNIYTNNKYERLKQIISEQKKECYVWSKLYKLDISNLLEFGELNKKEKREVNRLVFKNKFNVFLKKTAPWLLVVIKKFKCIF